MDIYHPIPPPVFLLICISSQKIITAVLQGSDWFLSGKEPCFPREVCRDEKLGLLLLPCLPFVKSFYTVHAIPKSIRAIEKSHEFLDPSPTSCHIAAEDI